jgi:hypothetical protein
MKTSRSALMTIGYSDSFLQGNCKDNASRRLLRSDSIKLFTHISHDRL